MKTCTTCKVERPLTEFNKHKSTRDNLQSKCKTCCKAYREQNKEHLKRYHREWTEKNPGRKHQYSKSLAGKLSHYRSNAKRRGIQYLLTDDEFQSMLHSPCTYCGQVDAGGVDRIDSGLDYTADNCTPSCGLCNRMKMDSTSHDFLEHIAKIYRKSI